MPFYKITIILRSGKMISGIKEEINTNIDNVYHIYENRANSHYGSYEIKSFDCVMISKRSKDYKEYLKNLQKKINDKKY